MLQIGAVITVLYLVTNLRSHFLLVLSDVHKIRQGDVHKTVLSVCSFRENQRSESHTLISTVSNFHVHFPTLSSDPGEIRYKRYNVVST